MRPTTSRTKARRRALDVLFEADTKGVITRPGGLAALLDERQQITVAQGGLQPYAVDIVAGVAEHIETIDETITTFSQNRTMARMASVDRNLLRLGVWEIVYNDDVDDPVAISQAVHIAEELSTEESPKFINAFLDRVSQLKDTLRD